MHRLSCQESCRHNYRSRQTCHDRAGITRGVPEIAVETIRADGRRRAALPSAARSAPGGFIIILAAATPMLVEVTTSRLGICVGALKTSRIRAARPVASCGPAKPSTTNSSPERRATVLVAQAVDSSRCTERRASTPSTRSSSSWAATSTGFTAALRTCRSGRPTPDQRALPQTVQFFSHNLSPSPSLILRCNPNACIQKGSSPWHRLQSPETGTF